MNRRELTLLIFGLMAGFILVVNDRINDGMFVMCWLIGYLVGRLSKLP